MHVFGWLEDALVPGGNPREHGEAALTTVPASRNGIQNLTEKKKNIKNMFKYEKYEI